MVRLKIVSGKKAGASWVARRFPVHIGRSVGADLQLEDDGIWDDHLRIDFLSAEGFVLGAHADALATVNGQPVQSAVLHNGDVIEIGAAKIRFWLGEVRQRRFRLRESFTWAIVVAVTAAQIALVYWLLR
ncbi:MAG TPA: FHA domain-containing protein [Verrucomicrobiae bacterium]|nr:FHA domain-containing protein [Verrucomicrobiae bacterium]